MPQQFMPFLPKDKQLKINNYLRAIDNLRAHYDKTKSVLSELERAVVLNETKNMPDKNSTVVEINRGDFYTLKRSYTLAIKDKKEIFTFKGKPLLVTYAKYLIEYLETKFNRS